jgi:hypothetical protein
MRSIVFFIENEWAFGQIHHALIKRLWSYGIYSHLLDWSKEYNFREFRNITSKFDLFVTTPCRINLLVNHYGVSPSKIVAIAHHLKDIYWGINGVGTAFFDELAGYAVNHAELIPASKEYGISRVPALVKVGIEFDFYYTPVSERIQRLGYAGAFFQTEVTGKECKRMHLAQLVSERTGVPIDASARQDERLHFLAMPEFYRSIDCLIVPSTYETAGLPALEAAAAGRLVISTNVGYFDGSFGELAQMDEQDFVSDAVAHINKHRENSGLYKYVCEYSQQYVRDNFDWSVVIDGWLNVLI